MQRQAERPQGQRGWLGPGREEGLVCVNAKWNLLTGITLVMGMHCKVRPAFIFVSEESSNILRGE